MLKTKEQRGLFVGTIAFAIIMIVSGLFIGWILPEIILGTFALVFIIHAWIEKGE